MASVGRRRFLAPALIIAAAVVAGIGAGVALHVSVGSASTRPAFGLPALRGQAVWPAEKRAAPSFTLPDQRGRPVSLRSMHGHPVVLAFMDSRCHQVCPLEGRTLAAALSSLPARVKPVLLVVSVNPWQDTPASARAAASRWGLTGTWHWLLGTKRELAPIWSAYRIYVRQARGDIVHSDAMYLLDRNGFERAGFIYPFLPAPIEHDLRVLGGAAQS
jgi:protein SCO1